MMDSLALTITGYGVVCALLFGAVAAVGRPRPPLLSVSLVVLQVAATLAALLDAGALLRGRHRADITTNIGYLLTVVAVLPLTASTVRGADGRWANAAYAVGCLVLAVVSIRLHQTLGPSGG